MPIQHREPISVEVTTRSDWPRRWGSTAWNYLGLAVFAALVYSVVATLSGFIVPLTIAAVVGIIASPLVDGLHRHRVPRWLGAIVVMVALIGVLVGAVVLSVRGVIAQSDEIGEQLTAGVDTVNEWLADQDRDITSSSNLVDTAGDQGWNWVGGLASYAPTIFSSVLAFLVGTFLALFFTYYILADWHRLRDWLGSHLGVPEDLGTGILDDVTSLIRRGFYALSLSSLVTAVIIGLTMEILGLPLAFTVALVTFVTSYIPYLGAIFSGAFGFLVAVGAGGIDDAMVLLIVILVVQNLVQTVVGNRLTSSSLSLHPIASLISTIIGASLAGLLGAMLSAPILAGIIAIRKRVSEYHPPDPAPDPMVVATIDEHGGASGIL